MKKILIVEDDPVSSQALSDYLTANGYFTTVARTGPEGVESFAEEMPDLCLVDVQLPLKSGFEVCFDIRKTAHGAEIPILLMSAVYKNTNHAKPYAQRGLGVADYLVKPFSMRAMLARVQDLIGN